MSDAPLGSAPGSAGEMQATEISAKVDADTSPAEAKVKTLGQRLVGVARSSTAALSGIGRSLGGENFLGPISGMISSLGPGLDMIANKGTGAKTVLEKIGQTSAGIAGVGMAVAGLGAALQTMAAPLQRASAALTTAIANTNTAAGTGAQAVAAYKGQMDAAEKSGAKYGFTLSDMGGALSKLTVQTQDPAKALQELSFAETLASASGVSVSRAAEMIGRMHAGQFRYLRQFGIYIQNLNTQHMDVATATKRHADALQRLQDAEQNLNNVEEKIQQARQKRQEEWAQKVQDATTKAADAQQNYADLNQRLSDQESAEATKYAEDVQNANQAVADSERSLDDLRARNAASEQDRLEQQQEAIENAQQAYSDSVDNVRALAREQAASPATSGAQQIQQQEAMKNATDAQQRAQEKLNDAQTKSLETHEQQVSRAQEERNAEENVAQSIQKKNDVEAQHVIVQDQIAHQQQEVNKAYEASQRAAENLARITKEAAAADLPTLQEKIEESHAREAVAKATEGEKTAQDNLNAAKNIQAELDRRFQEGMDQFMAREKGLLEQRRKTWAGHFAALKADVINFFQKDLGDIGGTLLSAGGGIAGIGMIFNIGSKVTGFLKDLGKAKSGAEPIVKDLAGQMKLPGMAMEESAAGAAEAAPGIIASIGSILVAAAPIMLVVAAIALVAVAGYEIVTHWKEISKDLAAGWGKIEGFVKDIFGRIVNFFKKWGLDIILLLTPAGWIPEIIRHWGQIEPIIQGAGQRILDWFTGLPGKLLDMLKDAGSWLLNTGRDLVLGLVNGIFAYAKQLWHWFTDLLPGGIRDQVRNAGDWLIDAGRNLVVGLVNGIFQWEHFLWDFWTGLPGRIWDAVKGAGGWLINAGENVIHGLIQGLENKAGDLWNWIQNMAQKVVHDVSHPWELLSPSKVFYRMGGNLIQGLIDGLSDKEGDLGKQMKTISDIGGKFEPKPPTGPALTGGSQFGPMGLPGNAGTPGAGGPVSTAQVINLYFQIGGAVVGQRELFDQFRQWLLANGSRQGGNYLGAGSKTV